MRSPTMPKWLRHPGSIGLFRRHGSERRGAARYDVHFEVWLRRSGLAPIAGSIFNLSVSGAAIRVHGWNVPVPAAWPTRLGHGDEMWVAGLLHEPLSCWVISVEGGVLRVHFSLDEAMREELRDIIEALPAPEPAKLH